ncbi:succinylglutamate desuccinylase/aspartoacylase family protein [Sinorhizobium meliloti]|uniref:succinylglutamate desuccinylase/aspartoacylase family protein n=1 Tax=Rhizobium meliloti TaxID=382 RepID=UPI001913239F|nr:succinylglutamate desuccinylase/aspartoacylase family protein [Sinorhizobium meliloti]
MVELFTPFLSLQHDRRSRTSIAGTVCEGSVIFGTYRNPATSADSAADVTCISGRGKSVEHTDLLLLSSPIGLPQHWPFIKMHGLENYFVILDRRDGNKPLNVEYIVRICSNNTGVGGEQLLTIEPASDEGRGGEDFQYRRQGSRGMRQRHSLGAAEIVNQQTLRLVVLTKACRRIAMCFDAERVMGLPAASRKELGRAPTGFARQNRLALMSEAGANGTLDEGSISFHVEGVLNVARTLGILDPLLSPFLNARIQCDDYLWLNCRINGEFHADLETGDLVIKGQRLGTIRNLFGKPLAEVTSPKAGYIYPRRIKHEEKLFSKASNLLDLLVKKIGNLNRQRT